MNFTIIEMTCISAISFALGVVLTEWKFRKANIKIRGVTLDEKNN